MTTVLLVFAAAGLFAQPAPATSTPDITPPLITSTEVQAGDSPLVIAAKKAMAARQKAKDRINVTVTPGKGHVFQATGPVNVSFKMPPADPKPRPARQAKPGIDPKEIERKIQALVVEQERLAAHGHEPMGGDGSEEDYVDKNVTTLQKQIDDLRRQLAQLQGSAPRP